MNDEAMAAMERQLEFQQEQLKGVLARAMASEAVVQAVLATAIGLSPAISEPLLRMIRKPFSPGDARLSDHAAAWWSDVEVARRAHVERLIQAAQKEVAGMRDQASETIHDG